MKPRTCFLLLLGIFLFASIVYRGPFTWNVAITRSPHVYMIPMTDTPGAMSYNTELANVRILDHYLVIHRITFVNPGDMTVKSITTYEYDEQGNVLDSHTKTVNYHIPEERMAMP